MEKTKQEVTISMPLYADIYKPKKKETDRYYYNLNQYRNWHYQVNNKLKKIYKDAAQPFLEGLSFSKPIELTFTLWKRDKRRIDRANPLCIHEKFFCDALVESGCMPDDNDEFIVATHYYTGGIDRDNPRVDILISEVDGT